MTVHVDVEVVEDELWCDQHSTHHRVVFLSQPTTHEGVPLGPACIYNECMGEDT